MSLVLNDLLICCRQLEHDRATERKKEVEKFKRLIRDPETIKHLDRHSDSKQGKYLNWDAVFRFLQKYIQKETECLRIAKPNVSASTQASRQKKMQEISSLVKYFIKCANRKLFSVYFRLYLKPSQDVHRVLVARIIHAVTKGCCSQTDGLNSKF
ncbi:ATM isoform 22, partial [Pan troglodytes]